MPGKRAAASTGTGVRLVRPESRVPRWLLPLRDRYSILRWYLRGRPLIPPPCWKHRLVRRYGRRFSLSVLCESGTYHGDMVAACRKSFEEIYSVEIDPRLFRSTRERFAGVRNVHLLEGDSAVVLPLVLERIRRPCLFWLDGKAMIGGVTGPVKTPIRAELAAILAHPVADHVVLIDDARLLVGRGDYPALAEIEEIIRAARPGWSIEVRHDVLRAHPAG